MIDAMLGYFERLLTSWDAAVGGLPIAPRDPDVDPSFWQGPADEDGWAPWRPIVKTVRHDLDALAPDLCPWPPSIVTYANSFWFAPLDGGVDGHQLTLMEVLPGRELDELVSTSRGYRATRGLARVPIGIDAHGLQVVVDGATGSVVLDDYERDTTLELAADLEDLFRRLTP